MINDDESCTIPLQARLTDLRSEDDEQKYLIMVS